MKLSAEELSDAILAVSEYVRYVAIYRDGQLQMRERPGLSNTSSSESDKYEELIVNPTLLKLITQRGGDRLRRAKICSDSLRKFLPVCGSHRRWAYLSGDAT